jgi:hypothetical protein
MTWLRRPIVHFIALGGLLFAVKTVAFGVRAPLFGGVETTAAVVSAERVAELRQDWLARTGAPPDATVLAALIERERDDEALVREARRRGVHETDPVVQRRLLRNMQFLRGDSDRTPAELLDEAYALGFDRTDLVVRRRLIQKLTLDVFAEARAEAVSEDELRSYLQAHPEPFTRPARARLTHVFLSRDRRGDAVASDAKALLRRIEQADAGPRSLLALGDPFLFPRELPPHSEQELAKIFGPDFAERVADLPVGAWSGPVPSAYGLHLVWVHDRTPEQLPILARVRDRLREAVLAERSERALRAFVAALRARDPIRVEAAGVEASDREDAE